MTILIATCNRLPYLKKCIQSILDTTDNPEIYIVDDCSTDGTREFLKTLDAKCFFNEEIQGTANNYNFLVEQTKDEWFVITNDDMFFHSGWQKAVLEISKREDCGVVSFFNHIIDNMPTAHTSWSEYITNKPFIHKVDDKCATGTTGLGASYINRESFHKAQGFILPKGKRMGYFASKFVGRLNRTEGRNKVYLTLPHYATHMDNKHCPLNEIEYIKKNGYANMRNQQKRGRSLPNR